MKISKTLNDLTRITQQWKIDNLTIGFVPTMGHLHAGHIELVNQARAQCDKVVVSIFVNPLQFNQVSDLQAYPKTLPQDKEKLSAANVDCLFLPATEAMYPQGQSVTTKVCVPGITRELEGELRPGHFDGVSTVVNKLFNLIQPQFAYFGEKDFQQLLLIKQMVKDLNIPVEIRPVATYRETDGLAMSSRNSRLTEAQRLVAPQLFRVLQDVARQVSEGQLTLTDIEQQAGESLLQKGFEVEYVSVRDDENLVPATNSTTNRLVLSAARLGEVRLIDNLRID